MTPMTITPIPAMATMVSGSIASARPGVAKPMIKVTIRTRDRSRNARFMVFMATTITDGVRFPSRPSTIADGRRIGLGSRHEGDHEQMAEARGMNTTRHPLEPLDADEMRRTAGILRDHGKLGAGIKVIAFTLREPTREELRTWASGRALPREVLAILLEGGTGDTEEVVVSLTDKRVVSSRRLTGVQPPIVFGELRAAEQAVHDDPRWQAAMRRRGVTDFSLCMVDLWSAGNFGTDVPGQRLCRALTWARAHPSDNGYAHPVDGVVTIVDLNALKVVSVEDHRLVPVPAEHGNYTPDAVGRERQDVKPLEIRQPDGPSFAVDGHEIRWQKWRFRIGFNYREGLILHTIGYEDGGRERPILHRAALSDMVVPYGDPRPGYFHPNAVDAGEYGIRLTRTSHAPGP